MTKNIDYFLDGPETLRGAERVAKELFRAIEKHHGQEEARRIFKIVAEGITKTDERRMERDAILERFDQMSDPNVMELARQLEAEGYGTQATIDHRIRELLRKRKTGIAEGTWTGPPIQWGDMIAKAPTAGADEPTDAECRAALQALKTKKL
jgi:hypothetical protein